MYALYQTISGIRIWPRIAAIKKNLPSYNALDIGLMVIFSISGFALMGIGGIDFFYHHPFSNVFFGEGVKTNLCVAFDLWILLKTPSLLVSWGWAIHAFKMIFVWTGLIIAFLIRLNIVFRELDGLALLLEIVFGAVPDN